jgi:hypothetical protein
MVIVDIFNAAAKKVPVFCWLMVCLCLVTYTGTLCYVMIRASTVNVEVNGMTMELTRAATKQDSAADEMERAARTIADLRLELAALTAKAEEPKIPFFTRPTPAPVAALAPKVEAVQDDLKAKAAELRESAQQTQQATQRGQQQQQQQQR